MLFIRNLECQSFLDAETDCVNIRSTTNQAIPNDLVIECLMGYKDTAKFPLGTKFITNVPFSIFYR